MEFLIGLLCGVGLALAVRAILLIVAPLPGVEKPGKDRKEPAPKTWAQTRNFLYYDGTVMPEIKEDANEQ